MLSHVFTKILNVPPREFTVIDIRMAVIKTSINAVTFIPVKISNDSVLIEADKHVDVDCVTVKSWARDDIVLAIA